MLKSYRGSPCYAHEVSRNCHGFKSCEQRRTCYARWFFQQGLRVNAAAFIEVLETFVKPWINSVRGDRPYVFQQDSAPAHKAMTTQDWMVEKFMTTSP